MSPTRKSETGEPPESGAPKADWRVWARRRRSAIDPWHTGQAVAARLREWPAYLASARILVYLAFGDEPDLSALLDDPAKSFYTTRTATEGEPALTLHRLDLASLERHRFGFLQPTVAAAGSAGEMEMVLVPGLAFDVSGHRLGFGMGFYDRFLGSLDPSVPLVGITPAELLVPRLPSEPHDVRMTHLATEDGVFPAGSITPWSR
ncbi:MAG: 5-formyltetrahydrofolate cyclo-ligase [Trueperaceae bacterium]